MEPSLSRRERKKLETRQALFEAALSLFREQGYDETTIEEITQQADVAKGTFFNYFGSKEGFLGELSAWWLAQLHETLELGPETPGSPMARLKLLLRRLHQEFVRDWPLLQRATAARLGHPPTSSGQAKQRIAGLLSHLIREAQECGEVRADVEPGLVSDLLLVAYLRQFALCAREGGQAPAVDDSERAIDLLMDGLAGPNWRRV